MQPAVMLSINIEHAFKLGFLSRLRVNWVYEGMSRGLYYTIKNINVPLWETLITCRISITQVYCG